MHCKLKTYNAMHGKLINCLDSTEISIYFFSVKLNLLFKKLIPVCKKVLSAETKLYVTFRFLAYGDFFRVCSIYSEYLLLILSVLNIEFSARGPQNCLTSRRVKVFYIHFFFSNCFDVVSRTSRSL